MAKEITLVDSYTYRGFTYGPGTVTAPDDEFVKLVEPREKATKERLQAEGRAAASLLPSGHPYHVLLAAQAQQPPQFEGEATPVPPPPTITTVETSLLEGQVGEGDSDVDVPKATTDSSKLTTTATATAAPGSPQPAKSK